MRRQQRDYGKSLQGSAVPVTDAMSLFPKKIFWRFAPPGCQRPFIARRLGCRQSYVFYVCKKAGLTGAKYDGRAAAVSGKGEGE